VVRTNSGPTAPVTVSIEGRVAEVRPNNISVCDGDLVRVIDGAIVERIGINSSARDLVEQDWWRLHRVLPNLKRRAAIESELRAWFIERDFLMVRTPLLAACPGLEVQLKAVEATVSGESRYLMTSPEFHMKRLLSAGIAKTAYLGPAFRDDETGHQHHTEFTMLEWYRADAQPRDLMTDVEALVELATGTSRPWTTLTVANALERYGTPTDDPDQVIRQLVETVEPALAKLGAVFLTEYPAALASLARLDPDNPLISQRFEAYIDGVELANGFGELTDPAEQRARFEADLEARRAHGLAEYPMDERFLDALSTGIPPCSGIALGVDRLVMLAVGATHIDDVVAFPPRIA
jgi:lysyl-tRNA synthetase class 2